MLFSGAARIPRAGTIPMPRQSDPSTDPAAAPERAATAVDVVSAPPSFEAALAELEAIVARMESGELPLEQALAAYKRGAQLLQFCQSALKDAQQQVQILEAGLLQDFADADRGD
jgi:exodeoxyribonuclease VII small subunit